MAELDEPIVQPPDACSPGQVMIDGDVTVDISTEDLTELADLICDCIKDQTTELCECINTAAETIVEAVNNIEIPAPPVVVTLACQPCIAVNGVLDMHATISFVDGVRVVHNLDGEVDPATVEILDPCDPRCNAPCECDPPVDPTTQCCDEPCDCSPEDLATIAGTILKEGLI